MKKLILICLLILFIPLVSGKIILQTGDPTGEHLIIMYPKVDVFYLNQEYTYHFHVFNSSGKVLNSTQGDVDCTAHIYNASSDYMFDGLIDKDRSEFALIIATNTTGVHTYNIWCNSSENEYGFLDNSYFVTDYGINYTPGETGMTGIVLIIGIFAISILLLYLAFNMDKEKHKFLQLIVIGFVIGVSILIPKAVLDYTNNFTTALTFFIAMTWFVRVFWVYMLFYLLYEFAFPFIKDFRSKRK